MVRTFKSRISSLHHTAVARLPAPCQDQPAAGQAVSGIPAASPVDRTEATDHQKGNRANKETGSQILEPGLIDGIEIRGVVRTADERSAGHMGEAFLAGNLPVEVESFRRDVFHNRQMLGAGTEILA